MAYFLEARREALPVGPPLFTLQPRAKRGKSESSSTRFEWNQSGYDKLVNFNVTRGEENGRYLTQSEKDNVVANKVIPANPLPR
jgi:hypothetical protein